MDIYPRVRQIAINADALKRFLEQQSGVPLMDDARVYNVRVEDWSGNGHIHFFIESQEFPETNEATCMMHTIPFLGKKVLPRGVSER